MTPHDNGLEMAELGALETGPQKIGPPETGPPETGPPETGPPETGPPETGPPETLDRIMPIVYQHLRAIASRQLAMREGAGTLSPTGLVHEVYLKLVDQSAVTWNDRAHFFALASLAMRHILVDRAKARYRHKREGALQRVSLDSQQIDGEDQAEAMLDINDAVDRLAAIEPRLAQVVECRFFGGLSEEETGVALGITARTVQRDWAKARMLLRHALSSA